MARAHGFIRRCTSSATVSAVYLNVGGLAGTVEATGGVEDSSSTGNVIFTAGTTRSSAYAGGLVGRVFGYITTLAGAIRVGGLVGSLENVSTVSNSFALGAVVVGGDDGGALIGAMTSSSSVSNSYATGVVTGSGDKGGLVGSRSSSSTCSGALWNTTTNPALPGVGTGPTTGTFGYDDTALKQQATYTGHGWDFTTIWQFDEGENYAELR